MIKGKDMIRKNKKVIVAMSGGVDSSVAAALLKRRGFDVEGVFMRLWTIRQAQTKQDSAEKYAKAVADKLGIKLHILDLRKEFKKEVVGNFLEEFGRARTPNPCVVCNQKIKFGFLFERALKMGGDYIATGHYVKKSKIKNQKSKLLVAKDKIKDQSYFLYTLTQKKLSKILFPIGDYKKSEIYKIAEKWELPYKKGESFDICFLEGQDYRDFLKKYLKLEPGEIIDESGTILGEHKGFALYTIGQRADLGGPGPFYVIELNSKNNSVIVSNKLRDKTLYKKLLFVQDINWISGSEPVMPFKCWAKIRYGHEAVECIVSIESGDPFSVNLRRTGLRKSKRKCLVEFKESQRAITPGQSVVFYKKNEVLGGGVIS
jgi:tRNA-specific 2-thiouridylase